MDSDSEMTMKKVEDRKASTPPKQNRNGVSDQKRTVVKTEESPEPLELPPFTLTVKRGLRDNDSASVWNMVSTCR